MGYRQYDQTRSFIAAADYQTKSAREIFSKTMHDSMDPEQAHLRESRDSDLHPNSVPIIVGLDVTGSMGRIPENLIKEGLPKMISKIMELGIKSPQVLFLAIGDDRRDRSPLQVGQFESGDEEMNLWLERVWLESGGGGNGGESYSLAWYFAAKHTVHDAFEKRGQKGFIFTIGDEKVHESITASSMNAIMGTKYHETFFAEDLYKEASKRYHIFHINCRDGAYGDEPEYQWKRIIGEGLLHVNSYTEIATLIGKTVADIAKVPVIPGTAFKAGHIDPITPQSVDENEEKITL